MCGALGRCLCGDETVCDILTCACLDPDEADDDVDE